ncbi:MAG TPA: hypothetical protein VIJ87_18710 [Pyrinomonadaceae bacterium]
MAISDFKLQIGLDSWGADRVASKVGKSRSGAARLYKEGYDSLLKTDEPSFFADPASFEIYETVGGKVKIWGAREDQ